MLIEDSLNRQKELNNLLYNLSTKIYNENEIRNCTEDIAKVYKNNFRHSYADFFSIVQKISSSETMNLEYLANNLQEIRKYIETDFLEGGDDIKKAYRPVMKLSDHINLEIAHLNYYNSLSLKKDDLESQNKQITQEICKTKNDLDELKKYYSSAQVDLVTVLGIFAAIVFTFSGSFALIGNVLSNITNAPFFKTIFFLSLSAFIVCNLIFLLLYLVAKIVGKNIYAKCKTPECSCEKQCLTINRFRKRLPYIFWINVCIICLLLIPVLSIIIFW